MKQLSFILFLVLVLSSCGNKVTKQDDYDWTNIDSLSKLKDSIERAEEPKIDKVIKEQKKKDVRPSSYGSSSSRSNHRVNQDNMRGFDPASEDDMEDNGMSRYMENNDEEGWD